MIGRKTNVVLYTFGYGGRSVEELASIVAEYDAVIVDVRLRPFSGQKGWSLPELKARFGEAYHWWRCLGNVNFAGGTPKLKDAKKGLALLAQLIETTSPILLCGERNPWICHRRMIAERLHKKVGCRVVHLPVLERGKSSARATKKAPQQLTLDFGLPVGHVRGHIRASRHATKSHRSQKPKGK